MVAHTCNPTYVGSWDKIWQDQGQPGNTDNISNNKVATKWNSSNSIYLSVQSIQSQLLIKKPMSLSRGMHRLKWEVLQVASLRADTMGHRQSPRGKSSSCMHWASVFKDLRYTPHRPSHEFMKLSIWLWWVVYTVKPKNAWNLCLTPC